MAAASALGAERRERPCSGQIWILGRSVGEMSYEKIGFGEIVSFLRLSKLVLRVTSNPFQRDTDMRIPGSINELHDGEDRRQLIVNGDSADRDEYPWQVQLGSRSLP